MCEQCASSHWNRRAGIYEGLCVFVEELGPAWGRNYEMEIMNVALFAVKSAPREMPAAAIRAFQFLVRICAGLYGRPRFKGSGDSSFVWDMLAVTGEREEAKGREKEEAKEQEKEETKEQEKEETKEQEKQEAKEQEKQKESSDPAGSQGLICPCDDVLQILITEMASTKQIVR
jgi:hypothetical protein